jgi:diguanylate cyclase (GGDEF)-like protein
VNRRFRLSARKFLPLTTVLLALALLIGGVTLGTIQRTRALAELKETLASTATQQARSIENYFERARSIALLNAQNPAFSDFYAEPGSRLARIKRGSAPIREANRALAFLESLYPTSIGEACFIDASGPENARAVRRDLAPIAELSPDESGNPFFGPTFNLSVGEVYQAQPYVSPDTKEWVISNSTIVPTPDGKKRAIVHFEVTVDSFRREAATARPDIVIMIVERSTGRVVVDSRRPQLIGRPLGRVGEADLRSIVLSGAPVGRLHDRLAAIRSLAREATNANHWSVVATERTPLSFLGTIGGGPIVLSLSALLILIIGALQHLRDQRKLTVAATCDSLTGLANRPTFRARVADALSGPPESIALLFIDLDDFKTVNDEMGHLAGDELLISVAMRLQGCVRANDLVARLGGDEFAVMVTGISSLSHQPIDAAERILEALRTPFAIQDKLIAVRASIGIARPKRDAEIEDLLRSADIAMYAAKAAGKSRFEVFRDEMRQQFRDRVVLMQELRTALEEEQFEVYYQPLIQLGSKRISSVEALVRWRHPTRGLLLPGEFLDLAEESGLTVPLGCWIIDRSFRQLREWRDAYPMHREMRLAINLSSQQLRDDETLTAIRTGLRKHGLPASAVIVEITETVLATDVDECAERLQQLHRLGISIAVDDFGTGYTSLSQLRKFPVDCLKIDRSFVRPLASGTPEDSALAHAIVRLGQTLGMSVVAEGIETPAQEEWLERIGCPIGQGFQLARPAEAGVISSLLERTEAATSEDDGGRASDRAPLASPQRVATAPRVLVADDDEDFRSELCQLLEVLGMDVVAQAANGEQALEILQNKEVDIALLDLRMPGMGGIATAKRIRHRWPRVRSVILSAHDDESIKREAKRSWAFRYLVKGSSAEEIRKVLHSAWQYEGWPMREEISATGDEDQELIDQGVQR